MDLLQQGAAWLVGQNTAYMSSPVTYSRPSTSQSTGAIQAKLGKSDYTAQDGGGITVTVDMQDYIVAAADLVLGGTPAEPMAGDQIVDAGGTTWEVMPLAGQQFYRSVEHGLSYRIHVKKVENP